MTTEYMPCIIIARGGSTRIPRKNLKLFCGKPLVAWSILASLAADGISETYVSTDDDEIEEVSEYYGARVIRRDHVSDKYEMGGEAQIAAVEYLQNAGYPIDGFISLLPTSPCRRRGDLDKLINLWYRHRYHDNIFAYNPRETVIMVNVKDTDGGVNVIFDKAHKYFTFAAGDCVSHYPWFKTYIEYLKQVKEEYPNIMLGIVPLDQWQCQDTDTEEQWEIAEYWFKKKMLDVYGDNPYEEDRLA